MSRKSYAIVIFPKNYPSLQRVREAAGKIEQDLELAEAGPEEIAIEVKAVQVWDWKELEEV